MPHREKHHRHKVGWLRAAVLGANDGIVSTASLLIGIAAAGASRESVMLAGSASLVAGAMSMAAGEYVSVHSQADTEKADLELEERELARSPGHELQELTDIYVGRGLSADLASKVAVELTEHDALGAHARDELGIHEHTIARPLQAAGFSAVSFALGAALPLAVAFISPLNVIVPVTGVSSLLFLAVLGAVAAKAGGANMLTGAVRVLFWGAAAMVATALVGGIFGTAAA